MPPAGAVSGGTPTTPLAAWLQMIRWAALASSICKPWNRWQSSVKDVKLDMDGDLVKAYVIFDFHGNNLSLELDGHRALKMATLSSTR